MINIWTQFINQTSNLKFICSIILFSYEHASSSSISHPFNTNEYDIPIPAVQLAYGFPDITPKPTTQLEGQAITDESVKIDNSNQNLNVDIVIDNDDSKVTSTKLDIYSTDEQKIDSSTNNVINNPSTSVIIDTTATYETITPPITTKSSEILSILSGPSREKRSILNYSLTPKLNLPTTAEGLIIPQSRTRHDDEGKWKIIVQGEKNQHKASDYL